MSDGIVLGTMVQDKVTGFKGKVVGMASYLYGEDKVCVAPKCDNNEFKQDIWYDRRRLIAIME